MSGRADGRTVADGGGRADGRTGADGGGREAHGRTSGQGRMGG